MQFAESVLGLKRRAVFLPRFPVVVNPSGRNICVAQPCLRLGDIGPVA
jgi:hypothetical protein